MEKKSLLGLTALLFTLPSFAATPIDLSLKPASFLMMSKAASTETQMNEFSRSTDFNQTLHVRTAQSFRGYPVWGSDAVIHIPQGGRSTKALNAVVNKDSSMNGIIYQNIKQDLDNTPAYVFESSQIDKAIAHAVSLYQDKAGKKLEIQHQQGKLIVYPDKNNKAHWAYQVSFLVPSVGHALPQQPTFIMDAKDFTVYQQWNNIKTNENVNAGGFGGNHKTGKKVFDGLNGNPEGFVVQRDASKNMCYMKNDYVVLKDARNHEQVMSFACSVTDPEHNNIYWNANHDQVLTTWSPSNDALFGAEVTRKMFRDWYNMPMLKNNDGTPMYLPMIVHDPIENAYWDGEKVVFGNSAGSDMFNPFTQLDTVGHEICHGFTEQHSNLAYYSQSGGLNEAFSDMAGIAAEYYAFGETKFLVGLGDVIAEGEALRYMDQPSKDCKGGKPGNWCSIDHMSQYDDYLNVHFSSGIFNRVYYLLATTPDWNARKAFDVMVQANMHYWTATTSFKDAACGVIKATRDYKYDVDAVVKAFSTVGLDTTTCK